MRKSSRHLVSKPTRPITVGIDLGDRFSRYCVVSEEGEVMEEGRIPTTAAALSRTSLRKRSCGLRWSVERTRHG